ncbi:MAG: hypothetical protein HIU83_01030 [Proteobacteria bacterium]|nr:hypothetical protein [Pseudomonadota bacterium]
MGMERFILKIPGKGTVSRYGDPYEVLRSIDYELRRKPGTTDEEWESWDFQLMSTYHDSQSGVRPLNIHQNYGIRHQGIAAHLKKTFKEAMPKFMEMFPEMPALFQGRIEFHSHYDNLKEVHFIQP